MKSNKNKAAKAGRQPDGRGDSRTYGQSDGLAAGGGAWCVTFANETEFSSFWIRREGMKHGPKQTDETARTGRKDREKERAEGGEWSKGYKCCC